MENKVCIICHTEKDIVEFTFKKIKGKKPYVSKKCKACTNKLENQRRKEIRNSGFFEDGKSCHNNLKKYLLWKAKGNAFQKKVDFNLDITDIVLSKNCPLLEVPYDFNSTWFMPSVDRIVPELGYVKGNIKIISFMANHIKSHASKEQLLTFSKNIEKYLNDEIVQTNENKESLELKDKEPLG